MPAPSSKFYGKIWVGFCLNTGKLFFLEVSFWSQQKEHRFFSKTVLGIFKIALSLKDRHVFMWQSVKILNFFNGLTLKQLFCKTKTFFKKLGYCFSFESTKFENASFPCKTGISEGNVNTNKMVTTKWTYRKERSFASNYFIIIIIIVFFFGNFVPTELICCTNNQNDHICTFCKRWSFIWRCFFLVSVLNSICLFFHLFYLSI